ncbi:SDR family oxidoreductase [Legionella israelensis]|uniref:SDR family oxidoreductase n=1 Tax=Legionella israelensis TaxID=454 RepID=A0A0W0W6Y2_9GAMM|nr:SDR family oxidoreductase [Legionella israelensis]KTD28124.1 sepiapterin reductase [Legionella israelensis]QBR83664.1 SDR family oxidoreductase [Legionella israelensis]QBS08894.1 SDR family oxidoreductase [Legionella israelensis]SCY31145.1 NAD(P)-dependent dehydrogenase, short-chain alcohol dehydrogenase family [Legionella israelensis DSM 19235]STX58582.1 yueD sepiapterin reductase [Legionella israelensis]
MFVITGGGSGIGKELSWALADRGCQVLIIGRRKQLLMDVASYSSLIETLNADLSDPEGRSRVVEYLKDYPHLKGLINNAGRIEPIGAITEISVEEWQQTMATNVDAPMFLTQQLYPQLQQGRVLNIGSGAAYFPVVGWAAYCVSKAALAMLTRSWQLERQMAIASVMPGIIDTAMQAVIRHASDMENEKQDFFRELKKKGKLIAPETVAEFLCWLLLDVSEKEFISKEWDVYDTSHHSFWLKPPHQVPPLES